MHAHPAHRRCRRVLSEHVPQGEGGVGRRRRAPPVLDGQELAAERVQAPRVPGAVERDDGAWLEAIVGWWTVADTARDAAAGRRESRVAAAQGHRAAVRSFDGFGRWADAPEDPAPLDLLAFGVVEDAGARVLLLGQELEERPRLALGGERVEDHVARDRLDALESQHHPMPMLDTAPPLELTRQFPHMAPDSTASRVNSTTHCGPGRSHCRHPSHRGARQPDGADGLARRGKAAGCHPASRCDGLGA